MKSLFRFFAIPLLFCLMVVPAHAQNTLKAANRLYDLTHYAKAIPVYKSVLKTEGNNVEVLEGLGKSYYRLNNTKEAEHWFEQAYVMPKFSTASLYMYAQAARRNENYEKAKELFEQYAGRDKTHAALANKLVEDCNLAIAWKAAPKEFDLKKAPFNSENSDFSPVFYKNGLLFSSDRPRSTKNPAGTYSWTGKPYLQLYAVQRDSTGKWGTPEALPNRINTSYHNAVAAVPGKGDTVYFTRTGKDKVRRQNGNPDPTSWEPVPAKSVFVYRLELFSAEFKNDAWAAPKPFEYNKPKVYSTGHPAFSPDGNTLYFASDMPGGFGDTDLYFCTRNPGGGWSKPVNCGQTINTPGKEVFPTVSASGTLYFSSDWHSGMGGLDLFSAEGALKDWTEPMNLQAPFNSGGDDFGIIFEPGGTSGFLSSNRNSETGSDHIYSFAPARTKCQLAGRVVEQQVSGSRLTGPAPGVPNVKLKLFQPGDTAGQVTYSDETGNFTFTIETGLDYTIKGYKEGYLTKSADITPDCQSTVSMIKMIKLDMPMAKNTRNNSYVLENIYYNLNRYNIRPDAAKELDKLVVMLQDNPNTHIELSSHTDSRHSNGYNQLLSQLRAEAAVNYMVSRGIDARRLVAKGYGETKLLNRCRNGVKCSEKEHQLNRRTEFKLTR